MHYHTHAALTVTQRMLIRQLRQEGATVSSLARRFGVSRPTIRRWAGRTEPHDRSSAPQQHGGQIATPCYRDAVLAYRAQHPTHGPKRIAYALRDRFPTANSATIWRILNAAGLSKRAPKKTHVAPD